MECRRWKVFSLSLGESLSASYTRIFLFSPLLMVAEGGDIHQGGCRKPSVDKRASSACGCGDPPERWKKTGESNVLLVLQCNGTQKW